LRAQDPAAVELIANREVRGEPARKVRTDQSISRRRYIHRTIANIESCEWVAGFGITGLEVVVSGLGKGPDVVLCNQAVGRVVSPATIACGGCGVAFSVVVPILGVVDLVGERLRPVAPHLQQPCKTEFGFGAEVRRTAVLRDRYHPRKRLSSEAQVGTAARQAPSGWESRALRSPSAPRCNSSSRHTSRSRRRPTNRRMHRCWADSPG
jgi:hypothetical protein